jgi:hypothetical protein
MCNSRVFGHDVCHVRISFQLHIIFNNIILRIWKRLTLIAGDLQLPASVVQMP